MKPTESSADFICIGSSTLSLTALTGLTLAITSAALHAQTAWDGGGGTSVYSNNLNWATDIIPGNGNANGATIGNALTQTVIYNTAASYTSTGTGVANRLIVGTGSGGNGSLTLSGAAGTLTFGGDGYNNAAWIGAMVGAGNATGVVTVSAGKLAITAGTDASINLGVLQSGTDTGAKSGTLIINGGTVEVGRRILMGANSNSAIGAMTISSGTLDMKRTGSSAESDLGMIRLGRGNNTVNLDGGTVIFSGFHTSDATSARSSIYMNGTTLRANVAIADLFNGTTTNANLQIKNDGLIVDTNNFSVGINDALSNFSGHAGILRKEGAGTLTLSGASSYSGGTTVSAGTLTMNNASALGSTSGQLTVNGGTLDMGSQNLTVGNLTGTGGVISGTSGTRTLTIGQGNGTGGNYQGQINNGAAGTTALTKTGNGTITLSGTNGYTGATNVTTGTLIINGSTSSTSVVTVNSGATLGGSGTVGGNTTISGIHSPGTSPGIQTFSGNLGYTSGSSLTWELASDALGLRGTDFDGVNVGGNLDFAGATAINLTFDLLGSTVNWNDAFWDSSYTGTSGWLVHDVTGTTTNSGNLSVTATNWTDGSGQSFNSFLSGNTFGLHQDGNDIYLTYTVVPEPGAALLGSLGLLALLRRRRN